MSRRSHAGRGHRHTGRGNREAGRQASNGRKPAPDRLSAADATTVDLPPRPPGPQPPVMPHEPPSSTPVDAEATRSIPDGEDGTPHAADQARPVAAIAPLATRPVSEPAPDRPHGTVPGAAPISPPGCTAPQLRRFIKSRPYVPMHELRRRFGINGAEDDVTLLDVAGGPVYVGLPAREGALLGELFRGGEVGYELSLDPRSPIVIGVYPMRPIPRP